MNKSIDKLSRNITIYHKENNSWKRYVVRASFRNTSYLSRDKTGTGTQTSDNAIIRIFDVEGYNKTYKIKKGDIIYSDVSNYQIDKAPLTELQNLYGKDKVFEVSSIEEFIFDDENTKELQHIKVGGR